MMGVRVSRRTAAKVDAARGGLTRSEWLRQAVEAYLASGAVLPSLTGDAGLSERLGAAVRGSEDAQARLRAAMAVPLAVQCPHKRRARYCTGCRCLVDADGFPVRAP